MKSPWTVKLSRLQSSFSVNWLKQIGAHFVSPPVRMDNFESKTHTYKATHSRIRLILDNEDEEQWIASDVEQFEELKGK